MTVVNPSRSHGIYHNPSAASWSHQPPTTSNPLILKFHQRLPEYKQTPLVPLPDLAKELGVSHVLVKDESTRFGLPSFKILGASWAIYCAVAAQCGLDATVDPPISITSLGDAARQSGIHLVTCSDGNWGRATARMARYLGIPATVFVPQNIDDATQVRIRSEGATVGVVEGNYDDSIATAKEEAERTGALLVMDTSWAGFTEVSSWVVEGYSTALEEVDQQLVQLTGDKPPTCIIGSVGVGSWMQSVTAHFKAKNPPCTVATVEPETSACLKASLEAGKMTTIRTGDTIMCGMNCGTVSEIAWPVLRNGVDAAVAISDWDSHRAVQYLHGRGVNAGPCGAASVSALRMLKDEGKLELGADAVVVLLSTEGYREYNIPPEA
ncbi:tryptophan synthase beta subunit-like PLP-dependent enzyme [Eremomyces bilateralis CBS 781.70]|uniref:Tryptophan synthase beta subunit-like PLP-dependent enzyme n=1 Tax=Eremomyces bilateralis CBS 781.70 TaxID=1392243 RepID=A0A6G1GEF2_9PEZI|nr:tryptophan synthase beta subunit-like PLP-dependent enzyme [Eremomyces bilateralis CBS 781.70]KAF1816402.1 tryptophan synthase beta subunit-like PLP-dependent enzyme [Eremomyces bilateralis CBS 781.70]